MTAHKDLKSIIRERQLKTGESYTAARAHIVRARAELLGLAEPSPGTASQPRVDAIVLSVGKQSARVRVPDEHVELTFRSGYASEVVPGHVVKLAIRKRWTWRGETHASGTMSDARIDVPKLGLEPLPLEDFGVFDLRNDYEPHVDPDPYAPLWRKLTAEPRACFKMDPIAWGVFPDATDPEDNATCDAAELAEAGDVDGARALLMKVLRRDLRCIDAHVHLGNLEFDHAPRRALVHYEIGVKMGELSLPPGFDALLLWGPIDNRPFLRALYNSALCCWRLGRTQDAEAIFTRVLTLNPPDNQGARFCVQDLRKGISWETMRNHEARAEVARFGPLN